MCIVLRANTYTSAQSARTTLKMMSLHRVEAANMKLPHARAKGSGAQHAHGQWVIKPLHKRCCIMVFLPDDSGTISASTLVVGAVPDLHLKQVPKYYG